MRDVGVTILVALGSFLGTNVDDFFALSAQLAITEASRQRRAAQGQMIGVLTLIVIAATVGSALGEVPLHAVGVLAVAPVGLAIYAWRHRSDRVHSVKRGLLTTFIMTVSLGGDNIAVWTPLFRSDGVTRGVLTAAVFIVADLGFLALTRLVARHPRVIEVGGRIAPTATPILYLVLAVVIAWECRLFQGLG